MEQSNFIQSNGSKPMNNISNINIEPSLQLPSRIYDLGCGCSGSTSLFQFFRRNHFNGRHFTILIDNKVERIGDRMQKNLQLNRPILESVPSHVQYISDLKLCHMWSNDATGVQIVQKLASQNPSSLFIMTIRPLSNWIECTVNFPMHSKDHSKPKLPAYKYYNTTPSKQGRLNMEQWLGFHCNVIEYFHRISQLERLIIFDIERDTLSVFKEAFYKASGYWLQGMLPEKNHHSDHVMNVEEQSGRETLNSFCGLYVEKETQAELQSFKKELYLKTHIGANHTPQDHMYAKHRYTPPKRKKQKPYHRSWTPQIGHH